MTASMISPHFSVKEMACPCCGSVNVDPFLVAALERLRDALGRPIVVNSAVRCAAHNAVVGGSKNSQHTYGKACDIRVAPHERWEVLAHAFKIGFTGVGIYQSFVHVDVRDSTPASWLG